MIGCVWVIDLVEIMFNLFLIIMTYLRVFVEDVVEIVREGL